MAKKANVKPAPIIHPEAEIRKVPLDLIDTSPFQTKIPSGMAIREMAASFRAHGMRQMPLCRPTGDRYQLAWGHTRVEAARHIVKNPNSPEEKNAWKEISCQVQELTLEEMGVLYIVENTHRRDFSKLDLARSYQRTLQEVKGMTEVKLAEKLGITQGHVSNMVRILELPERVIQYVEEEKISITQAREMLVLVGFDQMMIDAAQKITKGGWGYENTVNGMMKAVYRAAESNWMPLFKETEYYSRAPVFNYLKECANCEHARQLHKSQVMKVRFCTNVDCWNNKQGEAKGIIGSQAKAKAKEDAEKRMEAKEKERLMQQAEMPLAPTISQEIPQAPAEALSPEPVAYPEAVPDKDVVSQAEEILENNREALGTRAEVVNLETNKDQFDKQTGELTRLTKDMLEELHNPQECLERCTKGFHYAYDARRGNADIIVCDNKKCMTQKRAALTRMLHSEGAAKKRAEESDFKNVLANITTVTKPVLILALEAMFLGWRPVPGHYDEEFVVDANWIKGQIGVDFFRETILKNTDKLRAALEQKSEAELIALLLKSAMEYRRHHKDIGDYQRHLMYHIQALGLEPAEVQVDSADKKE